MEADDFEDIENERLKTGADLLREAFGEGLDVQDILAEDLKIGFIQDPSN